MRLSADPTPTLFTVARTLAFAPDVKTSEPCACCAAATAVRIRLDVEPAAGRPVRRVGPADHAAARIVERVDAGRREEVARHVVVEDHEVARDRDRRLRPADAVDRRNRPLNSVTPPTTVPAERGQEDAIALDDAPSKAPSRKAIRNGAPLMRSVGRAAIVICCLSTSSPTVALVFQAGDQRPGREERIAVVDDRDVEIRPGVDASPTVVVKVKQSANGDRRVRRGARGVEEVRDGGGGRFHCCVPQPSWRVAKQSPLSCGIAERLRCGLMTSAPSGI